MSPVTRTYDKHWRLWARKELEGRGIKVDAPLMPEPWEPDYIEWKRQFDKLDVNKESILVGYSCGGGFLVRWLGDTGKRINRLILVAPAISHSGNYKHLTNLLKFEIDKNIRSNINKIIIFVSDNDSEGILKSVRIFSEALNVKPVELKNRGHFTLDSMGTDEFPELLSEILK